MTKKKGYQLRACCFGTLTQAASASVLLHAHHISSLMTKIRSTSHGKIERNAKYILTIKVVMILILVCIHFSKNLQVVFFF